MTTPTLITVAPTGAESAKADVPALPVTLDELVATAKECEAVGASVVHVHIRDDDARPTLDLGPAARDRGGAARLDRPDRPALLRRRRHRPRVGPAGRARRRAGDGLLHHGYGQLRRRRLPQPVAVRGRPAHPDAGARDRAGVRDLRPGPPRRRCSGCWAGTACRPAGTCTSTSSWAYRAGCPAPPRRWSRASGRCATCRPAPRSRPPGSAGPRCRSCWPRSRPAAICGSAWRTPSRTRRISRWRATPSWSPGRPRSPGWPSGRR